MRNVGVSLREPLQTLSAGPAGGLHPGPALLLGLFPGTAAAAVFQGAEPLLLRDRVGVLVPVGAVGSEAAALPLGHHASRVNTLRKQRSFRDARLLDEQPDRRDKLGRVHTTKVHLL